MSKLKSLLAASAVVASLALPSAASAATLLYSFTPTSDAVSAFTFNADSNPVPLATDQISFSTAITNNTQSSGSSFAQFYTGGSGGGFDNFFGAQLFSGSLDMPTLLTGTFALTDGFSPEGILNVSEVTAAVPEPATWMMMLFGFGAIGFAMRRRPKVTTTVAFA